MGHSVHVSTDQNMFVCLHILETNSLNLYSNTSMYSAL